MLTRIKVFYESTARAFPKLFGRSLDPQDIGLLSESEVRLLIYAAFWPRNIGLPVDAVSYHDQIIIDDLVQRGYLSLFNNNMGLPSVYWVRKSFLVLKRSRALNRRQNKSDERLRIFNGFDKFSA